MSILCRLLVHRAAAGPWNMAVDEVLAHQAGKQRCCFRLYAWVPATLSLGYFQRYADRRSHRPSATCPVVRRPSGGGAIVHDRETTYSLVVPRSDVLGRRPGNLYHEVHRAIAEALSNWGLTAALWQPEEPSTTESKQLEQPAACAGNSQRSGKSAPFLCFQRRSCGDLVVGSVKVAGSAQRRTAAAVLQHGSILLARSPAAPELPGAAELAGQAIDEESFAEAFLQALSRRLHFTWKVDELSHDEQARAAELVTSKYASDRWTIDRQRPGGNS